MSRSSASPSSERSRRAAYRPALAIAAVLWGIAHSGGAAAPAPELAFERYRLDNGLNVILHRNDRLPIVAVNLWYGVGSKDEAAGKSGFAHLFEHLMFMGTRAVPEGVFDRTMERHGGSNNATTSQDRTNYFESGPSNLLETLLFLEADRLRTLGKDIDRAKLDTQREIVRNERRQNFENRPYGKSFLELWPLAYPPEHPYRQTVIGSHEDLENATVADVQSFFATFYVPGNASLVVAGDFDEERVRSQIERYFGDIPAGKAPPRRSAPDPRLKGPVTKTLTDKVRLPRTMLIWHSPALFADGDADMDVLATALGDGKAGRLYRRLVVEKDLAQDVGASQWSAALGSLFVIQATARPGVAIEALEAEIDALLREAREHPFTERECERARNGIESLFWHELEALAPRADLLNRYQFHFGDPGALSRDLARYERVTPETAMRRFEQVVLDAHRVTLRTVPEAPQPATEENDS